MILKSLNSKLLENTILDINDQNIFGLIIIGAIPGKYNLIIYI